MPWRPTHVEKLRNHNAKPAMTGPSSPGCSAIRPNNAARWSNSAAWRPACVATTASGSRSYAASSRINAKIVGTSSGRAGRITLGPPSCPWLLRLLGRPEDGVDLGDLVEELLRDGGVLLALCAR